MKRKMFLVTISLLFFVMTLFGQTSSTRPGITSETSVSALKKVNQPDVLKAPSDDRLVGGLQLNDDSKFMAIHSQQTTKYSSGSKIGSNHFDVLSPGQNHFNNRLQMQTGSQLGFMKTSGIKGGEGKTRIADSLKFIDLSRPFGPDYFSKQNGDNDNRYNAGVSNVMTNGKGIKNRVWPADLFPQLK